jgi:hypothetical protein
VRRLEVEEEEEKARRESREESVRKREIEKEKQEAELEEYHMQLALEMSAREDPEATQIEVAKQISLGSCPLQSSPAEVVAFRYWVLSPSHPSCSILIFLVFAPRVARCSHCLLRWDLALALLSKLRRSNTNHSISY